MARRFHTPLVCQRAVDGFRLMAPADRISGAARATPTRPSQWPVLTCRSRMDIMSNPGMANGV